MTGNTFARIIMFPLLLTGGESPGGRQPSLQGPAVVRAVAPLYPAMAATLGISGTVIVEVQIDTRGSVASVRSVDGPELLHKTAEHTARRWLFASTDDQVRARTVKLYFTFHLLPEETSSEELFATFLPPYSAQVNGRVPKIKTLVVSDPPISKSHTRMRRKKK